MSITRCCSLVILIDSLGRGGAQRALIHLVAGLHAQGYRLCVIGLSGDDDPDIVRELSCAGADVCSIGKGELLCGRGLWRVWQAVRPSCLPGPDLVLTMLPFADQLGRVCGRLAGVPVVSSERSLISFRPALMRFMDRWTGTMAQRIVFNSREALRQASAEGLLCPGQGVYIPNGVTVPSPSGTREDLRARLDLPSSCRVVGTLGRFTAEKGTKFLVDAFVALAGRYPDLHLVIGGEGPLRAGLEQSLARAGLMSRARLPGVQPAADLLACMDVFVLPSLVEGMPNALMEAMLAGVPVVGTAVGAVPDLLAVADGSPSGLQAKLLAGLLVPAADASALVGAVSKLLDAAPEAAVMAAAARAHMSAQYSHEATVRAYDAVFCQVLQSSPNTRSCHD